MINKFELSFCYKFIWLSIIFIGVSGTCGAQENLDNNYSYFYQKGTEFKEDGKVEAALNSWLMAVRKMNEEQLPYFPSELAFDFIELVTDKQLKEYYSTACDIYFHAFKPGNLGNHSWYTSNKNAIEREIKRLEPLSGYDKTKQWLKDLKDDNKKVLNQIKLFWMQMDYAANTSYNERLMEHWERIAYAKEHFTKASNTVYGTDERALIYIKYGKPYQRKYGILNFDFANVNTLIREVNLLEEQKSQNTSVVNPNRSLSGGKSYMSPDMEHAGVLKAAEIQQHYTNPKYSFWKYYKLSNDKLNPVIYIFGEDANTGKFQQVSSLEEMIPNNAFRSSNRLGSSEITPSAFIQLMMYEDLAVYDDYFAKSYEALRKRMMNFSNPVGSQVSHEFRHRNKMELKKLQLKAPEEFSDDAGNLFNLDLGQQFFRILVDNKPHLLSVMHVQKNKLFDFYDILSRRDKNIHLNNLELTYSLEQFTADSVREHINTHKIDKLRQNEDSGLYAGAATVFNISHPINEITYKASAVISDPSLGDEFRDGSTFKSSLLGVDVLRKNVSLDPLNTNLHELEMSDPVLGYGENKLDNELLPFYIAADGSIPEEKNLKFLVETYHLSSNEDDQYPYTLTYSIKKDKKILGIFPAKKEHIKISLNLKSNTSLARNIIEVETRKLEPGDYSFTIEVDDSYQGEKVKRKVPFTIK